MLRPLLLTISIIYFTAVCLNAQEGIAVDFSKIFFRSAGGTTATQAIKVKNKSDQVITLLTYFADWQRDSLGNKIYHKPGSLPHSCAEWLTINPQSTTLQAQEERELLVSIRIPDDTLLPPSTHNAMLFLRQAEPVGDPSAGIRVLIQLGVHVYYNPPKLRRREIAIRDLRQVDSTSLQVTLENTGALELTANIQLELTHLDSGIDTKAFLRPLQLSFMPGDLRHINLPLPPELAAGAYSALAIVDIGPQWDLQVGMLEFER